MDIHTHILPGLDDGPAHPEISLQMLRLAAAAGTTDIVLTPHASPQFPYRPEAVKLAFENLSRLAAGLLRLHLGCDFHLELTNLYDALRYPEKYTINGHQYLMVELPEYPAFQTTQQALLELIRARFIPVITHPERNPLLQHHPQYLRQYVAGGCLVQVTAQSFLGYFGRAAKRSAHRLLHSGLIHFIASDAHDPQHRPPVLNQTRQYLASRYGDHLCRALFLENPSATLTGDPIPFRAPKTFPITRILRTFWRARA